MNRHPLDRSYRKFSSPIQRIDEDTNKDTTKSDITILKDMETTQEQQQHQPPHHLMKRVIDSKTQQECITTSVLSPKPNQVISPLHPLFSFLPDPSVSVSKGFYCSRKFNCGVYLTTTPQGRESLSFEESLNP